jgi:hypothetical protein
MIWYHRLATDSDRRRRPRNIVKSIDLPQGKNFEAYMAGSVTMYRYNRSIGRN